MKIELQALSKKFEDDRIILDNIDFSDDVNTMAIIGPSGGGKSTLLRIIGGLLLATSGTVTVNGETIPTDDVGLQKYRKDIGFVFQQGGLFRHMTALDNIAVPLIRAHGYPEKDALDYSMELLTRFNLQHDALKRPFALSVGQQQRVAIARAVAAKPKFLLLDEPTSALDPEFTTEVLSIVDELKSEGLNFIIVTHEMGFARHACDKIAFLYSGKLLEYGDSGTLFSSPKTQELQNFLGKLLQWNV